MMPPIAIRVSLLGLSLAAALSVVRPARATDFSWQAVGGLASGDWSDPAHWNPTGGPPGPNDIAIIDLEPGSAYTVTLDVDPAMLGFTQNSEDAAVIGAGRTILIANGVVTLARGVIADSLSFSFVNSQLTLGAANSGDATFSFNGGNNSLTAASLEPGRVAVLTGSGDAVLNLSASPAFQNRGRIELRGDGRDRILNMAGVLLNQGQLIAGSARMNVLNLGLSNEGTVEIRSATQVGYNGYGLVSFCCR